MTKVLDGVRVLEVSMYGFVPAAGAVLADWGAEVIKVEHPTDGDPMRSLTIGGIPPDHRGNSFMWDVLNRGKKSVGIDLATESGQRIIVDLATTSDVFLTSLRPSALARFHIGPEVVMDRHRTIVYARGTGQGPLGPEVDKGGFDSISYWFRSGAGTAITPDASPRALTMPGPAFGDIQSGAMLARGIGTALGHRDRTGDGVLVDVSLMAMGLWAMQPAIVGTQVTGESMLMSPPGGGNPLSTTYRTADGGYVALAFVDPDRYWPDFCRVVGRVEWVDDPMIASAAARREHYHHCVAILDSLFATADLHTSESRLSSLEGQWDVAHRPGDLVSDAQARANGYLVDVDLPHGNTRSLVAAPVQFDATSPELRAAPDRGEHTEEILRQLGRNDEDIARLRDARTISS